MQRGTIQATKGWRKVMLATLRRRSMERGEAHESEVEGAWIAIVGEVGGGRWAVMGEVDVVQW